jgi:hypothetical protein
MAAVKEMGALQAQVRVLAVEVLKVQDKRHLVLALWGVVLNYMDITQTLEGIYNSPEEMAQ